MERRSFLKKAGVTAGAGLLAACSGKESPPQPVAATKK